ncbi:Hypothetical predicted protein [Paramuricea clavata]|uniref:Uncharacterized protein n=1 Tax=Paramuricea clavata TaxID=317549 RepID=A0A7D9JX83_PARCT|nr:Hypothetical predicted protein [Paramuricea clavata]
MVQTVKNLLCTSEAAAEDYMQRCQTTPANQDQLQLRQDVQKRQHDVNSPRVLSKLLPEQKVVVFQPRKKTWTAGKVIEQSNKPRSYVIKTTEAKFDVTENT